MSQGSLENTATRLGWIAGLLLLAAIVISAVEYKKASQVSRVGIRIHPLDDQQFLITEEDVRTILNRSFGVILEGLKILALDVDRIERVLEADPYVLDAEVFLDAENEVQIELVQRRPLLRIIDENNLQYYLDETGLKMGLSEHYSPRVVVASGFIPPFVPNFQDRKHHLLKDLFQMAQDLREDEMLWRFVEQIYVDRQGDLILVPKLGRQQIIFGKYQEADAKWRRLKIFLLEGLPFEGWQAYEKIDLRYRDQVVAN